MQVSSNTSLVRGNAWFFVPFLIWVVAGGIALSVWSQKELFYTFNAHHTHRMDVLMPLITRMGEGLFITVLALLPLLQKKFQNKWYIGMALGSSIIVLLVTRLLKWLWNAPRPLSLYSTEPWFHKLQDWAELFHKSFPSGHTSSAFALFTLLAMVLNTRWKLFGLHLFILAFLVAYSRMYLAAHFFEDVYAGSILGTVLAYLSIHTIEQWRIKKTAS